MSKLPDKIILYVGKRDIAAGKKHDCYQCPIALALIRKYPKFTPLVGTNDAWLGMTRYLLCNLGIGMVADFDDGHEVKARKIILYKGAKIR
jgi:hypothetical protein